MFEPRIRFRTEPTCVKLRLVSRVDQELSIPSLGIRRGLIPARRESAETTENPG